MQFKNSKFISVKNRSDIQERDRNVVFITKVVESGGLQKEVKCEIEAVKRSNPASSIYHQACTPKLPDREFTATPIPKGFKQGKINHRITIG